MPIRLLIVDDHAMIRQGMRALFDAYPQIQVVGEAGDGRQALQKVAELTPQVVLMDLTMPGMNGIEAVRRCSGDHPDVQVLAVSMHGDEPHVAEMLKAGAAGYVLKNADFDEIAQAVCTVANGESYISRALMSPMLSAYVRALRKDGDAEVDDGLTAKEREVLQLLAEGHSAKRIAMDLHVSVKTVQSHRQHIMDKLGISSLAELTKYAIRRGMTALV